MDTRPAVIRSLGGYLGGVALGTMCLTLVFLGMRSVMDVGGACADGGPYVSAQSCPDGAGLALTAGIFGLFAAAGLMAWFGGRLGGTYVALVFLGWPALFISLGYNFFEYGLDPAGDQAGPEWGFLIPGVMFWLMGGIPLLVGLAGWRAARSGQLAPAAIQRLRRARGGTDTLRIEFAPNSFGAPRPDRATSPTTATAGRAEPPPASDPADDGIDEVLVSQLERLGSLHASGALTDEEFAAAKARILSNERLDA